MRQEFIDRAERIVDAMLESDPETAMWAGDHRFDDRLPNYSPPAVAEKVSMLKDASHSLTEIDDDELDAADRVDLQILSNQVAAELFSLTETRDHEWDPMVYNPGMLLDALLSRDAIDAAERGPAAAARMAAVPDALSTARAALSGVPRIYAETAAAQFRGVAALIRRKAPGLAEAAPGAAADLARASEPAATACEDFAAWLDTLPEGRSPRLGRRLWEAKLWHTLDTPLSASELLDTARRSLDEASAEIAEVAAELGGAKDSGDPVAAVIDRLAAERPDNDTVVDLARRTMTEASDFVDEHELVSLVDDPLEIVTMPEHDRGISAAYCLPPGMLETARVPTIYAISPTPADWSPDKVESFFAEYNNHMLRNLTVHEAMPGHYLQLAHARRYRGNTRVRAVRMSGTFVEGWGVYAEELMALNGFGGPSVRIQQLKMRLRMIINAILDQLIHCEELGEAEAMDLMTRRGYQSEGEAAGKWRRALLSSTQLSTYFVGYTEVSAIAAARPDGTSVRAWHDAMLAHGNPAPRHLRTLLGV